MSSVPSNGQIAAFVAPKLAFGLASTPFFLILPTFYAQYTQATLAALGTVLILGRMVDAATDPLMGWLTDRTRTRWGARKPWYFCGAVLMAVSIWFLFHATPESTATDFLIGSLAFFVGWTMFDIPGDAWLTELTRDYRTRARIVGIGGMLAQMGGLCFYAVSISGFFGAGLSPELMSAFGWIVLIALPAAAGAAIWFAPTGQKIHTQTNVGWTAVLEPLRSNGPMRVYLLTQVAGGLGDGIFLATQLFVLGAYFNQAENFAYILVVHQITQIVAMPLWLRIVYRIGKHRAWAARWLGGAILIPAALLIPPGENAFYGLLALTIIRSMVIAPDMICPRSLMADAVDFGILKTHSNAAGSYFALSGLTVKAVAAVASGVAFWLLAAVGFDPKPEAVNDASAISGLLLVAMALPAALKLLAALVIWKFPIDERRAAAIRRRIESRAPRADAQPEETTTPSPSEPAELAVALRK